ncbi:MAG TPA: quinate 5-dehydrogenase [Bacillota bacterium]
MDSSPASPRRRHVVSVSIGSSKRDHRVEHEFAGIPFLIERRGTDGDIQRAIDLIQQLDGKVDAFGMGGIDLYVVAGRRRYVLRDAVRIARAAEKTPIVDGSGLKATLERRIVRELQARGIVDFAGKRVLMVSSVDRFGMAEELARFGSRLILGDLVFLLGLPIPLHSLTALERVARILGPLASRMPIHLLYPTGSRQETTVPRHARLYHEADIIAGDFHLIRRFLPPKLDGQIILTNTVTEADIELLRAAGASLLITTTPNLAGRSFGTNVMEAVLVAASGKPVAQLTAADYEFWLDRMRFEPRVERLG